VRAEFLTKVKNLADARAARQTTHACKTRGGEETRNKIAMLQGCVRQASLRELEQQILAREKFKFSPKRFAKQSATEIDS
jgi:hypothetical protein